MTDKQIIFNISASSYSMYKTSPLQFYYSYVIKAKADTIPYACYGLAGTIVHNILEDVINGTVTTDYETVFNKKWESKNLDNLTGFRGNKLKKPVYLESLEYGIQLIKRIYNKGIVAEEKIQMPFYFDEKVIIGLKGYIDAVATDKNGDINIIDWKTNSSVSDFSVHAKMYFLLYLKKHKVLPTKAIY